MKFFSSSLSRLFSSTMKMYSTSIRNLHSAPDFPRVLSSMVKIYTVGRVNTESRPWVTPFKDSSTGSGFILSDRRIITNAHCVAGYTLVSVKKPLSGTLFKAQVLAFGHICDLALLSVEDEDFWTDLHCLDILDKLPSLSEVVHLVGYPRGADSICITKGIVSRFTAYSYGSRYYSELPVIQIDAAINPGNSGGPVLLNSKVIGVVFQKITELENIGFVIPSRILLLFLKSVSLKKKEIGFSSLGTYFQTMENNVLREYFCMGKRTGVLVIDIFPNSCLIGNVKQNDVLLEVNGIPIQNDGEVFCGSIGININAFIALKEHKEKVSIKFLRLGEEMDITVSVDPVVVDSILDFAPPSYFVYAGFVFTISQGEQLKIAEVLESDFNMGYTMFDGIRVRFVNRRRVFSLKVLSDIIHEAQDYVILDLENSMTVVINRKNESQDLEIVSKIKAAGGVAVIEELESDM